MKSITTCLLTFCLFISGIKAQKFDNVTLPASLSAGKDKLIYNGGGIREKYFMDMYVAGLYLLQKNNDASKIVRSNESMAIKLHIVSSLITPAKMETAVREGFENAKKDGFTAPSEKINELLSFFKEINVHDEFDLIYIPGEGVQFYKNKTLRGTIKGEEFKKALFSIWLGSVPADEDLKKGLLGKN